MKHTTYRSLTDDELLRECEERRPYSHIIEELCQRIEAKTAKTAPVRIKLDCTVCGATLNIDGDHEEQIVEPEQL